MQVIVDTTIDTVDLTWVDMNRCAPKHYLSGADVLYNGGLSETTTALKHFGSVPRCLSKISVKLGLD